MVFIFGDFGVYSKHADAVESLIKKHNHIDYKKVVYEKHLDVFSDDEGRVSMTWFCIKGCTRDDFEELFKELNYCSIPIALNI